MTAVKAFKVTCALIGFGEKVLVVQRSEGMHLPLKWEFPGGKIERNETEEECVRREVKEELNIDIEIIGKLSPVAYNYPNQSIELIPFLAIYSGGEMKLAEHRRFQWLAKNELLKLDWAEADIPIVKEYLNL